MIEIFQKKAKELIKESPTVELNKIKIKILNEICKELINNYKLKNKKILLDNAFWLKLYTKTLFKKNSVLVHNLSKQLKEARLISSYSKVYTINSKFSSVNPLSRCFLQTNLRTYDIVLELREEIEKQLIDLELSLEKEILIYFYLELCFLQKIPREYYKYFNRSNLIKLDNKVAAVITLDSYKEFTPIKTIIFDVHTSEIFNEIFFIKATNIFDYNDYMFSEDIIFYEKEILRILNNKNISKKEFRQAIELEYQLNHSPLKLTINTFTNYPRLSLFEIEYLFPHSISKRLLDIEHKNMQVYRNHNPIENEEDEVSLDDYLDSDIELYDELKKIKKLPSDKKFTTYLNKWYRFINNNKNKEKKLTKMFEFCEFILKKADKRITKKIIQIKTMQGYLQVIFQYCFHHITINELNNDTIKLIYNNITNNDNLTIKSKRKYRRIINIFLSDAAQISLSKIKSIVNYNRSIVFTEELDKLINKLKYKDREYKDKILKLRRVIFVIFLNYTGLRKNELLSRTSRDIYFISGRTFVIDVNKRGITKINKYMNKKAVSLKNRNARRRIEFTIDNATHFNLVKKYFDLIEEQNLTFLFPGLNKSKSISKKRATSHKNIDEINSFLQETTKRYTTLHSFRHTYITNELNKLLSSENITISDIFELATKVGHCDPETTLSNYGHLDLIKLIYKL